MTNLYDTTNSNTNQRLPAPGIYRCYSRSSRTQPQWTNGGVIKLPAVFLLVLINCLFTQNTYACGESLFHVGKGVVFREYTAPLPGKILMVARTEAELVMAERLAAAGHEVHTITDPNQIGRELSEHDFDVVMTLFAQRQIVEQQTRNIASSATYIPVVEEGTDEEKQVKGATRKPLSTNDSVKNFLRAIHRSLKRARS